MPDQTMKITGKWTTDETGAIVFVPFPVPVVVQHDCDCEHEHAARTDALCELYLAEDGTHD